MANSRLGDVWKKQQNFLPACVVIKIRQTFPSEQYCGFIYAQVYFLYIQNYSVSMDKTSSVIFTIQCQWITHHLRFVNLLHIVTY